MATSPFTRSPFLPGFEAPQEWDCRSSLHLWTPPLVVAASSLYEVRQALRPRMHCRGSTRQEVLQSGVPSFTHSSPRWSLVSRRHIWRWFRLAVVASQTRQSSASLCSRKKCLCPRSQQGHMPWWKGTKVFVEPPGSMWIRCTLCSTRCAESRIGRSARLFVCPFLASTGSKVSAMCSRNRWNRAYCEAWRGGRFLANTHRFQSHRRGLHRQMHKQRVTRLVQATTWAWTSKVEQVQHASLGNVMVYKKDKTLGQSKKFKAEVQVMDIPNKIKVKFTSWFRILRKCDCSISRGPVQGVQRTNPSAGQEQLAVTWRGTTQWSSGHQVSCTKCVGMATEGEWWRRTTKVAPTLLSYEAIAQQRWSKDLYEKNPPRGTLGLAAGGSLGRTASSRK